MKEVKFYEAVESCCSGDEWRLYRTYDKDEAMRAANHYKSEDPCYKMEVREYTLPHPIKDLKGFDDPNSDAYDETIDVGEVFGFYNYEEVQKSFSSVCELKRCYTLVHRKARNGSKYVVCDVELRSSTITGVIYYQEIAKDVQKSE